MGGRRGPPNMLPTVRQASNPNFPTQITRVCYNPQCVFQRPFVSCFWGRPKPSCGPPASPRSTTLPRRRCPTPTPGATSAAQPWEASQCRTALLVSRDPKMPPAFRVPRHIAGTKIPEFLRVWLSMVSRDPQICTQA